MFKFIKNVLTDQNGNESSKRVIVFLAMIQLMVMVNRMLFGVQQLMTPEGKYYIAPVTIDLNIFWGLVGMVLVGLGFATAEFFTNNKISK